ncbi:hypothetical protein JCM16303_002828 [Sporobolomyces ruberrimus]
MKTFTLPIAVLAFATTLTSALPSSNSINQVGEAQYIEASSSNLGERSNEHELVERAWTRVTRSRPPSTTVAPTTKTTTPVVAPVTTTSSVASAAPTFVAGADVKALALSEHNRFRALHNAPALSWSQPLADAAYKWGSRCVFQHSQGAVGPYGENLAASAGYKTDINTGACQGWEAEAPQYDPTNPVYSHFTQMVWKATTQLGCAAVTCPPGSIFDAKYGNSTFYVCEYNPPGNVYPADNFRKNVE